VTTENIRRPGTGYDTQDGWVGLNLLASVHVMVARSVGIFRNSRTWAARKQNDSSRNELEKCFQKIVWAHTAARWRPVAHSCVYTKSYNRLAFNLYQVQWKGALIDAADFLSVRLSLRLSPIASSPAQTWRCIAISLGGLSVALSQHDVQ